MGEWANVVSEKNVPMRHTPWGGTLADFSCCNG